jgi:NAD(P)-dependent dehydrogenase (short-subunit alcohol dehydrogenase family)
MSHKNLVAFIIGAGPNVGAAVGAKLKENGYEVALGGRDPKALEGYFPVKVDVQEKESVFAAFKIVAKTLGPVNVVIYNGQYFFTTVVSQRNAKVFVYVAATLVFPPKENDILSLSVEEVYRQTAVGINVIAAAQAAITHFRDPIHQNHPKAFIVTGNPLPFSQAIPAQYFTLGLQRPSRRGLLQMRRTRITQRMELNSISLHFFRRRGVTFRRKSFRKVVRHMRRCIGD